MKKAPIIIIGVVLILAVLLGIMMFRVGNADDTDSILTAFNNMESSIKRPISVEEIIRQLERSGDEDDGGSNPPTPTPPSPDDGSNPPPPQDGEFDNEKTVQGVLQYIPQGDWWGSRYMNISSLRLGGNGSTVQQAGCYFCSLSMAAAFFRGKEVTLQEVTKVCGTSSNFTGNLAKGDSVLQAYGAGVYISGDSRLSLDEVKNSINANKPLIIHFKGATSSGYYSGTGHFALCIGYSDNDSALVLYDPGKGPASAGKKLTYSEYSADTSKGIIFMRSFK